MALKFVQTPAVALYSGLSAIATEMVITPYPRDIQTNTKLTITDFGDNPNCTVDPKIPSYEEICKFTGITDNGDNTATLTGLVRNLIGQSPYTTPGTGKTHGASAVVVFSDNPQMFARLAALENNNIFNGINEGIDPTTAQSFVTRDWILALINGGAISINAIVEAGTAGATIAAGNLLYFSETDNEWLLTDADTLTTLFNVKLGIAMGAGVNGGAISGGVLTRGSYTTSGLTQGDLCYASNTAGGINSGTSGTVPRVIGIAKDTTTLYFDPDFQNRLYDYVVSTTGNDTYVATLPGALSVPYVGMEVKLKVDVANTSAATFNGVSIKKNVTEDLQTGDILANQIVGLMYDGTNWQMMDTPSKVQDIQTFTANGTWTKPTGAKSVYIKVVAGGGSGGSRTGSGGGAGGGGGGCVIATMLADSLTGTVAVTVGAAVSGVTGETNGTVGNNSSFGSYLTAFGGGGGSGSTKSGGGGGGGTYSVGLTGATTVGGVGGSPVGGIAAGGASAFGGAGGGDGGVSGGGAGGVSVYGGGGGGGANSDDTGSGGNGGNSIYGGGGGGGSAGDSSGTAGVGGTSSTSGAGGNGSSGNATGITSGTAPGGGGGGKQGIAATPSGGGARGEITVITYF